MSNAEGTSIAYCSAGNPKASHPIGCKTLKPCMRLNLARISVAVYPRGWPTCSPAPLQKNNNNKIKIVQWDNKPKSKSKECTCTQAMTLYLEHVPFFVLIILSLPKRLDSTHNEKCKDVFCFKNIRIFPRGCSLSWNFFFLQDTTYQLLPLIFEFVHIKHNLLKLFVWTNRHSFGKSNVLFGTGGVY